MSAINRHLTQCPALNDALVRLKSGCATPDDFQILLAKLREWSTAANLEAIYGEGEHGRHAQGMAQAYLAILDLIDSADPYHGRELTGANP